MGSKGEVGLVPYDGAVAGARSPRTVPVTAIVLTLNEAACIGRCLRSLGWCEQVVVVDCGSTDGTRTIAEELGAVVIEHGWTGFSNQRNFALSHPVVAHDWVYMIDADEFASPAAADEIARVVEDDSSGAAAYEQRTRLVFLGRWIKHCGWYSQSWRVKLMRRSRARFDQSLTGERPIVDGRVGRLEADLVDDDRKGVRSWLEKHVGYADLAATAEVARRRSDELQPMRPPDGLAIPRRRWIASRVIFRRLPARPLFKFIYMYVLAGGFLDGWPGFAFSALHASHVLNIDILTRARVRELDPETGSDADRS